MWTAARNFWPSARAHHALQDVIRKSREDLDALRQTGVGGLGALACKNVSKLGQFWD